MEKESKKRMLLGLFGLAVLLCGLFLITVVFKSLWGVLISINQELAATIIATSGTILVAVATVVFNQRRAKEREIAEAHRDRKVEIYAEFMTMIVDTVRHAKEKKQQPGLPDLPDNIEDFFYRFTQHSIVWASPEIIQCWNRFKIASQTGSSDALFLIDDILREIRRYLGNSNVGLNRGDLIKMFINDPQNLYSNNKK